MDIDTSDIRPIEVVRALSVVNRWDGEGIAAVVAHQDDQPQGLLRMLRDLEKYDGSALEPISALAAGAFGNGLTAAATRGGRLDEGLLADARAHLGADAVARAHLGSDPARSAESSDFAPYRRIEVLPFRRNVNFLYDGSRRIEGLVVLSTGPVHLSLEYGSQLRDAAYAVAASAAETGLPIMFLHAPAALPRQESDDSWGLRGNLGAAALLPDWRHPADYCLRFSVAVRRSDIEGELRFRRRLVHDIARLGCGLFLRRREADLNGPGWETLLPISASRRSALVPRQYPNGVEKISMTLVGPARVGSTLAALRRCADERLGVYSAAVTAMEGLSFIHLGLLADPLSHPPDDDGAGSILGRARADAQVTPELLAGWDAKLSGFSSLLSRDTTSVTEYGVDTKPLWLAWQTPRIDGAIRKSITAMETALAGALGGRAPNIDFLVCREVREDTFRGRCKITFPTAALEGLQLTEAKDRDTNRALKDALGRACAGVEREWKSGLRSALRTPWVETEVAWRERWIGRLEAFLAKG